MWKKRLAVEPLSVKTVADGYSSDTFASWFLAVVLRTKGVSVCLAACYGFIKILKLDCLGSIYDQGVIETKYKPVCISLIV